MTSQNHYEQWDFYEKQEICCRHFGCGKHLSLQEQLFGNYCIKHAALNVIFGENDCRGENGTSNTPAEQPSQQG